MNNLHIFFTKLFKQLHYLYLLYAIPMVILTALMIPPFQNPDEPNHFMRIEQVSRGEFVPDFHFNAKAPTNFKAKILDSTVLYPKPGGFRTAQGILTSAELYSVIQGHPEVKTNDSLNNKAKSIKWDSGIGYCNFGNTALYTPLVYIMPAIGVVLGRSLDISVVNTLYISRLLNGAFAITLSFFALLLAKRCNILLFVVLLFPMTIELFSSVSQDAVLISCAFLLVGIIDNVEFSKKQLYQKWQIYAIIILMSLIGMAKPPYAIFAGVFLFLKISPKFKLALLGIPFLATLTWLYLNRINLSNIFAPPVLHINAKLQVAHILQHPFGFAKMFFNVDTNAVIFNFKSFVGNLGWLDTPFTNLYYQLAFFVLLVGFLIYPQFKKDEHFMLRVVLFIAVVASIVAVMSVQYITWTELDSPVLSGMQGRYLLPIFPFLALCLAGSTEFGSAYKFKSYITYLIIIFPLFTCFNLLKLLLSRYY